MRSNWKHLFTAQFLGVLNDNLLKSLICFIAIYWVAPEAKGTIISAASAAMVLPFILLSPLAGYLSQAKARDKVFEIAKLVELPIMVFALIGFLIKSLPIVLLAMLFMGIQSALYSPSKYGLIKDIAEGNGISKRLGTMELLSFSGVLLGTLLAGYLADLNKFQMTLTGLTLLAFAAIGYRASKKISINISVPNLKASKAFSPLKFVRKTKHKARQYKGVNNAVLGLAAFWFIGSMIQMNLLVYCPDVLGLTNTQTGWITAFVAVGIGLGCFVSGRLLKTRLEIGLIVFAGIGLTIFSLLLATNLTTKWFIALVMVTAFFGGLFKVPLNAWIQERTKSSDLGNILAYSNIITFLFILASALIFGAMQLFMSPQQVFLFVGLVSMVVTFLSSKILFNYMVRFVFWIASKLFYRIKVTGRHNIPVKSGAIIVCNHVSMLDSIIIAAIAPRNFRFVMHHKVYQMKFLGRLFRKLNMIPTAARSTTSSLEEFNQLCKREVESGHIICFFPEGQLSRNGHILRFRKGIEHLSREANVPIVPIHIDGLHGTPLSHKTGTNHKFGFNFSTLRNKIRVRIGKPITQPVSAFSLRQKIKELEVQNTSDRIQSLDPNKQLSNTISQLFQKGLHPDFDTSRIVLENLIINTPDYEVRDLSNNKVFLRGTKPESLGRAIPGATTKIVDKNGKELPENNDGRLMIFHAYQKNPSWIITPYFGKMDEDGFVTIY